MDKDQFLVSALLLIFVTLKLCDVIAWSWWWVLSPVWIPLAAMGILFCVLGAITWWIYD